MERAKRWMGSLTGRQDRQYEETLPLATIDGRYEETGSSWMPSAASNSNSNNSSNSIKSRFCANPKLRWLLYLLPFCVARPLGLTERRLPKTTSTTYLNGVRGLACWIVLNDHLTMDKYREFIFKPYGAVKDGVHYEHFIQLPVVRALVAGKGMVCVFFVLSGFVLSYSSLRKMNDPERRDKPEKTGNDMLTSISSMTLRRPIRLFAPMLALAVLAAFVTYYVPWGDHDHRAPNIFAHLYKFWLASVAVMDPYHWPVKKPLPPHFQQAWTLGLEYRLSLAIFLVLAATATLSTVARKIVVLAVAGWSVYASRRWEIVCAMGGFLLAELRFAPFLDDFSRLFNRPAGYLRPNKWVTIVPAVFFLLFGLVLVSWPESKPAGAQPYHYLWEFTPRTWRPNSHDGAEELTGGWIWWWGSIGAFFVLWSTEQLPLLQRFLSVSVLKYLGEISYSYYLLQRMARTHVGEPIFTHLHKKSHWSFNSSFVVYYIATNVACVLASDFFWRLVDESCVRLARTVVVDFLGVGKKPAGASGQVVADYAPVPTSARSADDDRSASDNTVVGESEQEEGIALKEGYHDESPGPGPARTEWDTRGTVS